MTSIQMLQKPKSRILKNRCSSQEHSDLTEITASITLNHYQKQLIHPSRMIWEIGLPKHSLQSMWAIGSPLHCNIDHKTHLSYIFECQMRLFFKEACDKRGQQKLSRFIQPCSYKGIQAVWPSDQTCRVSSHTFQWSCGTNSYHTKDITILDVIS